MRKNKKCWGLVPPQIEASMWGFNGENKNGTLVKGDEKKRENDERNELESSEKSIENPGGKISGEKCFK